jgi:hypothetical protein
MEELTIINPLGTKAAMDEVFPEPMLMEKLN